MRVASIELHDLDVALTEPFGIATGAQTRAENLLVAVHLDDGTVGWGEAAPFPAVNGETRDDARQSLHRATPRLIGVDVRRWRVLSEALVSLPAASARCALEVAALDALCKRLGLPMVDWFGGADRELLTDVTITTGTPESAREAAARLAASGIQTLKIKVGGAPLAHDLDRIRGIVERAPECALLLDGNGALDTAYAALALLEGVRDVGGRVVLFEQPLPREDLRGMADVTAGAGCPVAADESVSSVADVVAVAAAQAATVVNLKPTKSGFVGAWEMAITARSHGLGLMMGAMVESPLALSASAALAAGLGGFGFVDLDTHLWMIDPPIVPGFTQQGPRLTLTNAPGHGARPLTPG